MPTIPEPYHRDMGQLLTRAMILALTAACAMGQDEAPPIRPPVPTSSGEPPVIMNVLVLALIVAIVIGVQAIPTKRTHQD